MSAVETEALHAPTPPDPRSALRSRPFRLLTVAWACTNVADSVLALILAVWVKDLTGSNGAAGLVFAALLLPALTSPLLGQVADRVSRRRMMVVAYLVGAASLVSLAAVRGPGQVWLVLTVTVVYSGIGFATGAAQSGLVRDLLPDEALAAANGRLTTIDQTFRLVLPVVGAGVYALVGPLPLVGVAAGMFVAAAAVIGRMRLTETPPTPDAGREPFRREVLAGFRHLARTAPLGVLTLALGVAFGAIGVLNAVSFAVIEHGLHLGPEMIGPLSCVQGVTAIVAGLTAPRLVERFGTQRLVAVALAIVAAGIVPALGTQVVPIVVGMAAVGLGVTWAIVGYVTERQLRTPATLQGRTSAATSVLVNVPQLGTTVVAAGLVGVVDYRLLVAAVAVGLVTAAGVSLRGARTSRTPAPEAATTTGT